MWKIYKFMRIGTYNIGSMTGRGRELADLMEGRILVQDAD
jgi:hypothetical protein